MRYDLEQAKEGLSMLGLYVLAGFVLVTVVAMVAIEVTGRRKH
jgi:hypothetical protein